MKIINEKGRKIKQIQFSFLLKIYRDEACLISDGKVFHKLMCLEKTFLKWVHVRPMEERSLAPDDPALEMKG